MEKEGLGFETGQHHSRAPRCRSRSSSSLNSQHCRSYWRNPVFFWLLFTSTETGDFESVDITPLSSPPELPDVMKGQEAAHDTTANWRTPRARPAPLTDARPCPPTRPLPPPSTHLHPALVASSLFSTKQRFSTLLQGVRGPPPLIPPYVSSSPW